MFQSRRQWLPATTWVTPSIIDFVLLFTLFPSNVNGNSPGCHYAKNTQNDGPYFPSLQQQSRLRKTHHSPRTPTTSRTRRHHFFTHQQQLLRNRKEIHGNEVRSRSSSDQPSRRYPPSHAVIHISPPIIGKLGL